MRKKVLIWTLGAFIVLAASVNVGMNLFGNNSERELFLANVEALSDSELPAGFFDCIVGRKGQVPPPDFTGEKVRWCGDCKFYLTVDRTGDGFCRESPYK